MDRTRVTMMMTHFCRSKAVSRCIAAMFYVASRQRFYYLVRSVPSLEDLSLHRRYRPRIPAGLRP